MASAGIFDALYYNSGTYASPTLVKIDGISDLEMSDELNAILIKIRRFGHELNLPGQFKKGLTFTLLSEVGATAWEFLRTKWLAKTDFEVFVFYKYTDNAGAPTAGDKAIRIHGMLSKFPLTQPLEGADESACEFVPSVRLQGAETSIHEPAVYTAA